MPMKKKVIDPNFLSLKFISLFYSFLAFSINNMLMTFYLKIPQNLNFIIFIKLILHKSEFIIRFKIKNFFKLLL